MVYGKVFIRDSWGGLIVDGKKSIETAHISLPVRFAGRWLHVQNEKREIIGVVRFKGFIRYHAGDAFDADYKRHLVDGGSRYHYNQRKRTYGWVVDGFERWDVLQGQPMKSQFRLELY